MCVINDGFAFLINYNFYKITVTILFIKENYCLPLCSMDGPLLFLFNFILLEKRYVLILFRVRPDKDIFRLNQPGNVFEYVLPWFLTQF